ncbi:hypothetical protein CHS0354_019771, partial [Potamilus streckersoni]
SNVCNEDSFIRFQDKSSLGQKPDDGGRTENHRIKAPWCRTKVPGKDKVHFG